LARRFLRNVSAEMRLPYLEFDALDIRPFAAREPQDEVIIMGAEPIPQEAGRHGEMNDLAIHLFDLDTPKPTGKYVLS
jgi:hypothetical protein